LSIDWLNTPLGDFALKHVFGEDGKTTGEMIREHGDGVSQDLLRDLSSSLEDIYAKLIPEEDVERYERAGEVPIIRDGQRVYEPLGSFTLTDLPAVLDTLVALEEEQKQREQAEKERKDKERKRVNRVRAKERRKLKALGEWD
jgi:hypothetical protein